jgi:predicted membrane-bound spermidine synthase
MLESNVKGDLYLVLTTFVSGAIIMVIELLGSRVIGPPFGVSLFVWTSLITVTLVSLALGYWIGGRIADAKNNPLVLFVIILLAGVYLVSVPIVKGVVLEASLSLGLRGGSLVSSTVLFGPPLFLLGMVAPYVVKLYMAGGSENLGRTVGWLYAISTCGSCIGTLLTGFVLIPNLGVNNIIYLSSLTLIILTVGYFALFKRSLLAFPMLIIPIVPLFAPERLPALVRPDGTKVELRVNEDGTYGQIKVVDYSYGDARVREFLVDNIIQGGIDVKTGASISNYTYYIEKLAHAYNRGAENALVVGLGSGIVPRSLEKYYGIRTDVVEISQRVLDTANEYFAFDNTASSIYIGDGRYFLKTTEKSYDIIVLDAYSGDTPASHIMSLEAFGLAKERLDEDGVLLINFIGGNQGKDQLVTSSLSRTLKELFRFVDVYAHGNYTVKAPTVVNFIFVAYDHRAGGSLPFEEEVIIPPVYPPIAEDVQGIFSRRVSFGEGPIIFTDDYNPVDFYDLRLRERFRGATIRSADMAIVLD